MYTVPFTLDKNAGFWTLNIWTEVHDHEADQLD